jgi:rare lipoprotein A
MIPDMPPPGSRALYRVQIGAFHEMERAQEAMRLVRNVGLTPSYERYKDFYRVVLSSVKAEDMAAVAEKLGSAGFREVWLREER